MPYSARALKLVCHPETPDHQVRAIAVTVAREADGGLSLTYRLEGDIAALRVPDAPLPPERLWAHTCFEAFIAQAGAAGYREFNFSPNGQWMRFDFSGYRQRVEAPPGVAPAIELRRNDRVLEFTARLPAALLPPGDLVLALTTVVEHPDGSLHYWALAHPPGKPDFHHREGFALALKASAP